MPPLALVGNLSQDVVSGAQPRIGGGAFYGALALRELGCRAEVLTRCGAAERAALLLQLVAVGLPVTMLDGEATATFAFRYEGDRRIMSVERTGDAWSPEDADRVPVGAWVHVATLLRSDFPADTIARLAAGRTISLDAHGLVRPGEVGSLRLDARFDRDILRHLSILKLADEEAEVLAGGIDEAALVGLGVPEVVVTFGSRGCLVVADGCYERVETQAVDADPTGSGDAFAAAYLASRAGDHAPAAAARRATALVGDLLRARLR